MGQPDATIQGRQLDGISQHRHFRSQMMNCCMKRSLPHPLLPVELASPLLPPRLGAQSVNFISRCFVYPFLFD